MLRVDLTNASDSVIYVRLSRGGRTHKYRKEMMRFVGFLRLCSQSVIAITCKSLENGEEETNVCRREQLAKHAHTHFDMYRFKFGDDCLVGF